MLQYDTAVTGPSGITVASYGPRRAREHDGRQEVEECDPREATFWGVYVHNNRGEARLFADARDQESAMHFALHLAKHPDSETIAYLALGAERFMAERHGRADLADIGAVTDYAATIDTLARGLTFCGCFDYEVTEPFGYWFCQYRRKHAANSTTQREINRHLGALITACLTGEPLCE